MAELMWQDKKTKTMGIAYMTDDVAEILEVAGYFHCIEEDEWDDVHIEVWKPKN